jgi:glutathione S-transferase
MSRVLVLYDAPRCPYCARVRILLAEKGIEHEPVVIDLDDRPAWLYEKNPLGKVPVLEEGAFVLPESRVIMEYLEERYPDPPLLPAEPAGRALVRLAFERFDELSGPYYAVAFRGQPPQALEAALASLDASLSDRSYLAGARFGLADIAYVPWVLRAPIRAGVDLDGHPNLRAWMDRLAERPSIAAEVQVARETVPPARVT